jgi:hypothetical protein
MGYLFSIIMLLVQCIIINSAHATGHTVRNGGGKGEIAFTEVWKNLERTLAPLKADSAVLELLERRARVPRVEFNPQIREAYNVDTKKAMITISSRALYRDSQPISQVAMLVLALEGLRSCEAGLASTNLDIVARVALTFVFYKEIIFADGVVWRVAHRRLGGGDSLILSHSAGIKDLQELIATRLRASTADLVFNGVHVKATEDAIVVAGEGTVTGRRSVQFNLTIRRQHKSVAVGDIDLVIY